MDSRGTEVNQSVKRWALDLASGFDLRALSSSPVLGSMLDLKPTLKKKKKRKRKCGLLSVYGAVLTFWFSQDFFVHQICRLVITFSAVSLSGRVEFFWLPLPFHGTRRCTHRAQL